MGIRYSRSYRLNRGKIGVHIVRLYIYIYIYNYTLYYSNILFYKIIVYDNTILTTFMLCSPYYTIISRMTLLLCCNTFHTRDKYDM